MNTQEPAAGSTEDKSGTTSRSGNTPKKNDIYTDPALVAGTADAIGVKDPVQEFLLVWWRQLLYALLAVLGVTYFISSFREAREENLQASSDYYSAAVRKFHEYEKANQEYQKALTEKPSEPKSPAKEGEPAPAEKAQPEELKKKMEAARDAYLRAMTEVSNQAAEPYRDARSLYSVKEAILEKSPQNLIAKVPQVEGWSKISDVNSFERLQAELNALATARSIVDTSEGVASGKRILKSLAEGGNYAAVPAAVALSDLASTPEEKKEALSVTKNLVTRQPEQADLLKDSITRLEAETR